MSTLVIGAGMAGLAAGRDLIDANENVIILEARDRIGGRVHTDHSFAGIPVEFGAEFIHGDLVPTWLLVREHHLRTLHWRKTTDSMVRLADGSWRTMEEARRLYPNFDETRAWRLPNAPAALPGENLGEYLRRISFSDETLHYVKRSYANAVGDDMHYIGADFFLEDVRDTSIGEGDYRVLDGYDNLPHILAHGLDIRLETVVESIDWSGDSVRVTATNGQVFEADRVLITLPLGVLQSGGVKFTPALPVEKQSAIDCLRMGPGIKLIYRFAEHILPEGILAIYSPHNPPMWWSPSFGHDYEGQVITALATGDWARELLAMGEEGALQQGLATLRTELGRDDLQPDKMHLVNWPADPFALGGYSVTPPGAINARAQLAQPVENRLFWAGEATAPNVWTATVHGAYASGRRAAQEVLHLVR